MTTPTTGDGGEERSSPMEMDIQCETRAVTFTADGDHLVSGGKDGVRIWRLQDGKQVARMDVQYVRCLAVSRDGRWIAAGTWREVVVWDATTYERILSQDEAYLNGVAFSPDSTRLVTGSLNHTASVWDVAARQRVLGPLAHPDIVTAVKFSPNGTRIATATPNSVRVYDGSDGRLLVDLKVRVLPWYNAGLIWSNDRHLFAVSNSTIKHIDTYTSTEIVEWQVLDSNDSSCVVLPRHGEYIVCATSRTVAVWDTSNHSQLGLIQYPQEIRSLVLSPDGQFLVIAGEHGKITFSSLACYNDAIPLSRLHPTFQEPDMRIDGAALDAWRHDRLEDADARLTAAIPTSHDPKYHVLASRALVRTRLGHWDAALNDAEQSIEMEPSVIGYIAKSLALVGKGEKDDGYRACDIAFERFHSTHVSFILLIKAIIVFMAGQHVNAISRVDDLIATVDSNSICYVVQKAYMYFLLGSSHMDRHDYERAIQYFERARAQMRSHTSRTLSVISLISGWKFDGLDVMIQKHLCEALYAAGRTKEAGELLLKIPGTVDEEDLDRSTAPWVSDFMQRCLSSSKSSNDVVSDGCNVPTPLLREWVKLQLTRGTWEDALSAAVSFTAPKFAIYRSICERLEALDQVTDATECLHQMIREIGGKEHFNAEQAGWVDDIRQRFSKKLECLGDAAFAAQRHDEATSEYSAALSLDPTSPDLFIKRSKTYLAKASWKDALNDAEEVIKLDPSSPWGYERKHAALHKGGNYDGAIGAFETMLSKMAYSSDPGHHLDYINPAKTRAAIRGVVQGAIRDLPRVLINTDTGCLIDKSKQAAMFEALPVFKEMLSSMTMDIDQTRIEQEVTQYYRYATFSHRWEENEPLFDEVIHVVVYDLKESPTHDKLRMFCNIVRAAGFHWAWSDTCCINKTDHVVLQEALVAMFKWYEGSSLTIVYLRDVHSPSRRGDLMKSIWNTRAWTFQEYHASKVVRFFTADWVPYLNLDIPNHKESLEIMSEMEEATGVSAQILKTLCPGTDDIRDKLRLASGRETTLVEDAAYSLLGVFSASLSIVYGEGDKALGRLLAHLFTSSGDTSILAWTGKSGPYNSCLPAKIGVFGHPAATHIPKAISDAEMDIVTARLQSTSLNFSQAQKLYDRLNDLPVPMCAGKRMKLPCITFKLGPPAWSKSDRVFRAQTTALGVVEIKTKEDLTRFDSLYLVHPWIDFLLHRHRVGSVMETVSEGCMDDTASSISGVSLSPSLPSPSATIRRTRTKLLAARMFGRSPTLLRDTASLLPPASVSEDDKRTRVLQFVARLRQPFGALLFTPTRQNVPEYRRVASESTITVQVQEDGLLNLLENARMLDVL